MTRDAAAPKTFIDLSEIGKTGAVSAEEVLFLRRTVFADGIVSAVELDALFALADRAPSGAREWFDFFAEAAADFYLCEEEPHGYLTPEEFGTLKARAMRDGRSPNVLELRLMVRLMEKAASTPPQMASFVAAEIRRLITGRDGGPRIEAGDIDLIRRFLFAAGGAGNVAVTREEAAFLFDLNDACAGADNDPDWADLFAKAVANHLMAHIGYRVVDRAEALRREASFSGDRTAARRFGAFFDRARAALGNPRAGVEARWREANAERAVAAAEAEVITDAEADWIADRIGRDGALHDAERRLLSHLGSLGADLPPKLRTLLDRAA